MPLQQFFYHRVALLGETDPIIARQLEAQLISLGCWPVMVAHNEAAFLAGLALCMPEIAVLDLSLGYAAQLTHRLSQAGIPFVLSTWGDPASPTGPSGPPLVSKTCLTSDIESALLAAISRSAGWVGMPVASHVSLQGVPLVRRA